MKNNPRRCHNCTQQGLSLIEVVVSLMISSLIIIMGTQMYQIVGRTGSSMESAMSEWSRELFIRHQLVHLDERLTKETAVFSGEPTQLVFISTNSARFGKQVVPVVVSYAIRNQTLQYAEMMMPSWWDREGSEVTIMRARTLQAIVSGAGQSIWKDTLYPDVTNARFEYWDDKRKRWLQQWNRKDDYPPLVRLRFQHLNQARDLVMEVGGLSSFSSSGS